MFSKSLQNAFNDQIQKEFYSSYLYLAMAAHFESVNLPGFASWMKKQSDEERAHGMRLWQHVYDRGGKVELQAIEQPPTTFGKPSEVVGQVLEHEQKVTASVNALYALALKEGDVAAQLYLQWFVNEQVEEEAWGEKMVAKVERASCGGGSFYLDHHLEKELLGE